MLKEKPFQVECTPKEFLTTKRLLLQLLKNTFANAFPYKWHACHDCGGKFFQITIAISARCVCQCARVTIANLHTGCNQCMFNSDYLRTQKKIIVRSEFAFIRTYGHTHAVLSKLPQKILQNLSTYILECEPKEGMRGRYVP